MNAGVVNLDAEHVAPVRLTVKIMHGHGDAFAVSEYRYGALLAVCANDKVGRLRVIHDLMSIHVYEDIARQKPSFLRGRIFKAEFLNLRHIIPIRHKRNDGENYCEDKVHYRPG